MPANRRQSDRHRLDVLVRDDATGAVRRPWLAAFIEESRTAFGIPTVMDIDGHVFTTGSNAKGGDYASY
jgi:hypothetical protein